MEVEFVDGDGGRGGEHCGWWWCFLGRGLRELLSTGRLFLFPQLYITVRDGSTVRWVMVATESDGRVDKEREDGRRGVM